MLLRLFITTYKINNSEGAYILSLYGDNESLEYPNKIIYKKNISNHYLVLMALRSFLRELAKSKKQNASIELSLYTLNSFVAFEWQNEYLIDKKFDRSTRDKDIWKEIVSLVENNKINLTIYGPENKLSYRSRS